MKPAENYRLVTPLPSWTKSNRTLISLWDMVQFDLKKIADCLDSLRMTAERLAGRDWPQGRNSFEAFASGLLSQLAELREYTDLYELTATRERCESFGSDLGKAFHSPGMWRLDNPEIGLTARDAE